MKWGKDKKGRKKKREFNSLHKRYGAGKIRPHRAKDFKTWAPERQTKYLENRRDRLQTNGMSRKEERDFGKKTRASWSETKLAEWKAEWKAKSANWKRRKV